MMIRSYYLFIFFIIFSAAIAQENNNKTDPEYSDKKVELEKKAVEILDLRSALTIQENELELIKKDLSKTKNYNMNLVDSLGKKETEIENLRSLLKAYEEEKRLSREVMKSLETSIFIKDTNAVKTSHEDLKMKDSEFRSIYNESLSAYFDNKYEVSAEKFHFLVSSGLDHPLIDNAQYWLGECYYSLGKFLRAIEEFKKVNGLGDGNKEDAALFKIGMSYLQLGNKEKAISIFKEMEKLFPDSQLIDKTNEYIINREKF